MYDDEKQYVISELQELLQITYREAYLIVEEYERYGEVDLSEFDTEHLQALKPVSKEVFLNVIADDNSDIQSLSPKNKEIKLSVLNKDTKIELLTAKPLAISLELSNSISHSLINNLYPDTKDIELVLDIKDIELEHLTRIPVEEIQPLSLLTISSISKLKGYVKRLNDVSSSGDIQPLEQLSIREVPTRLNTPKIGEDVKSKWIKKLLVKRLRNNIKHIDIQPLETLRLNKINKFRLGQIRARANQVSIKELSIREVPTLPDTSNIEPLEMLSIDKLYKWTYQSNSQELEQLVLYDLPKLNVHTFIRYKIIEFDKLVLDDEIAALENILAREILPPVTKQDFIKVGADPDTVDIFFDDYKAASEAYSIFSIQEFFKYAITEKDEAIAAGGNYKGLYKIVTEERGTFLPFITELYMTDICQYDNSIGKVIEMYLRKIKSFLVHEAEVYNMEGI